MDFVAQMGKLRFEGILNYSKLDALSHSVLRNSQEASLSRQTCLDFNLSIRTWKWTPFQSSFRY